MRGTVGDNMAARVRIKDVATLAGVSTATVSRALSTPDTVGPATREKVMEIKEKLRLRFLPRKKLKQK